MCLCVVGRWVSLVKLEEGLISDSLDTSKAHRRVFVLQTSSRWGWPFCVSRSEKTNPFFGVKVIEVELHYSHYTRYSKMHYGEWYIYFSSARALTALSSPISFAKTSAVRPFLSVTSFLILPSFNKRSRHCEDPISMHQ